MADVAIGMAMHTKKERSLLKEGETTWIRNFKWVTFLIMMPCDTHFKFSYFIETRCTHSNIWRGIDDNFMTTHELLTFMYSTYKIVQFCTEVWFLNTPRLMRITSLFRLFIEVIWIIKCFREARIYATEAASTSQRPSEEHETFTLGRLDIFQRRTIETSFVFRWDWSL